MTLRITLDFYRTTFALFIDAVPLTIPACKPPAYWCNTVYLQLVSYPFCHFCIIYNIMYEFWRRFMIFCWTCCFAFTTTRSGWFFFAHLAFSHVEHNIYNELQLMKTGGYCPLRQLCESAGVRMVNISFKLRAVADMQSIWWL
jgi:hypothetical protein